MQIHRVYDNSAILEILKGVHPQKVTWVVSNLRSKLEIQRFLLQQYGYFEADSVMRVNELWKSLLQRVSPELQLISSEHAILLIDKELKKMKDENSGLGLQRSAKTIYNYISDLAMVLAHPDGPEKMTDWLSQNTLAEKRWGHWFRVSQSIFQWFVYNKKISVDWVSPYLSTLKLDQITYEKNLIFNLGFDILDYEIDIIKNLSQITDVQIFESLLTDSEVYKNWPGSARIQEFKSQVEIANKKIELKKFSTVVNEIKFITNKVRSYLEKGVAAHDIVVMAPQIEYYWPVLRRYFDKEGIAYSKKIVTKAHSFPTILKWISDLNIRSEQISYSDMEQSFYMKTQEPTLRFEKFLELYKNIYEVEDLSRHEEIKKIYFNNSLEKGEISRNDFLVWTIRFWPDQENSDLLLSSIKRFMQEIEESEKFPLSSWLQFLQSTLSRYELSLQEEDSQGVQICNVLSSFQGSAQYRVFIGLTEQSLTARSRTQISEQDRSRIHYDMGFKIPQAEEQIAVSELKWILQSESKEDVLSFSATDFSGELTSPHDVWLKLYLSQHSELPEIADVPPMTVWDSLQRQEQNHLIEPVAEKVRVPEIPYFSPSSLEQLLKCPFVFVSERLFRLLDPNCVDLEVNALDKGTVQHAIIEYITGFPVQEWGWSDQELENIIDEIILKKKIYIPESQIWRVQKRKLVSTIRDFVKSEKAYLQKFPDIKVLYREKEFELHLSAEPAIKIKGKIDRVDQVDDSYAMLLDYKSGPSSIKAFHKAMSEAAIQLPLYAMAMDKDFSSGQEHYVISAQFYNLKTLSREQGFLLKETDGTYYQIGRKKIGLSHEEKKEQFQQIATHITEKVQKLREGHIEPKPLDEKQCPECQWRSLCRAPHLL